MAKRRKARPFVEPVASRVPVSSAQRRKAPRKPVPSRRNNTPLLIGGAVAVIAVVAALAVVLGWVPGVGPGGPSSAGCVTPDAGRSPGPPDATPLSRPPTVPTSDGTRATIATELGDIVIELYCGSAPVAAQNFVNLASAGFYDGVVFHRIIPSFMIQGGDPLGTGAGGPGYTIPDEPVVGDFVRGTVAMARSSAPNSEGSQFFIVVADSPHLAGGGYTIFGHVVTGMDVADQIVAGPRTGPQDDLAADPVAITSVTVQHP
jgi:peptidyl-prolyl cis-trans isomerase B (cyclophilin B)